MILEEVRAEVALSEQLLPRDIHEYGAPRVFPGVVTDSSDAEHKGLLTVRIPGFSEGQDIIRAVPLFLYAGKAHGVYCLPETGDTVLVLVAGPNSAFVLGSFYAPGYFGESCFSKENTKKALVTKGGFRVEITEEQGKETLEIGTPKGQKLSLSDCDGQLLMDAGGGCSVALSTQNGSVALCAKQTLSLTVGESKLTMDAKGVQLSGGDIKLEGRQLKVEGKFSAELGGQSLTLSGGMSTKIKATRALELSGGVIKLNG